VRAAKVAVFVLLATLALQRGTDAQGVGQSLPFTLFERYLESLRQQAGIPGLSAAIVQNRRIVWERGFGLQDVESSIAATPNTPYLVGDLTQTFAAVLLVQCVERGTLELDEPMRKWTSAIPEPGATVRQVLAHDSNAALGRFSYDPSRYTALTPVGDGCANEPYRQLLAKEILDRLAMFDSVPGQDLGDSSAPARQLFDKLQVDRYASVLRRLATPYKVDSRGKATRSDYPAKEFNASTGLVSTTRDLARYDAGLDDLILLEPDSLSLIWTNEVSSSGVVQPSGLGWFVQSYNGERLVWHFGLSPDAFSSLILKVPGRDLTLILLANSDGLSAPFSLADGDVTSSLFARLFLRLFV
jgi:CubicO group peptidase (beta-lactamase class C family)